MAGRSGTGRVGRERGSFASLSGAVHAGEGEGEGGGERIAGVKRGVEPLVVISLCLELLLQSLQEGEWLRHMTVT